MSIDIDWPRLSSGPDAQALGERIREWLDDRFQSLPLPHFIRSVRVHAFDLGSVAPEITIRELGEPLKEFYEYDDEDEDEVEGDTEIANGEGLGGVPQREDPARPIPRRASTAIDPAPQNPDTLRRAPLRPRPPSYIDTTNRPPIFPGAHSYLESLAHGSSHAPNVSISSINSAHTSSTAGFIPGGTANMHPFNSPLASGFSLAGGAGMPSPWAAVAGGRMGSTTTGGADGGADQGARSKLNNVESSGSAGQQGRKLAAPFESPAFPPTNQASSHSQLRSSYFPPVPPASGSRNHGGIPDVVGPGDPSPSDNPFPNTPLPMDTQALLHIRYAGDVRLSLTAELLLDYPMPAFMGIPIKMHITGVSFDGVAVVAYVGGKRVCVCFLDEEEGELVLSSAAGPEQEDNQGKQGLGEGGNSGAAASAGRGSLLREIKVESEIGQNNGGKQGLKNMGKVEKFVLEQVRKVFEEELVYPSFWTFLI